MHTIALFGGTFDPIHTGHIKTSITVYDYFHFDSYYFLPCKLPVIKALPKASKEHRVHMMEIALKNYPQFQIDLRELKREAPSYMVDTLKSYRLEHKEASLTLILGYDAFLSLPLWYKWEELITLANLLVMPRNTYFHNSIPKEIKKLIALHATTSCRALLDAPAGTLCIFDTKPYDMSSTSIRNAIKQHKTLTEEEIPYEVYEYIKLWGLYQ